MSDKKEIVDVKHIPLEIASGTQFCILQSSPNSYTHGMFKYPCKFLKESVLPVSSTAIP